MSYSNITKEELEAKLKQRGGARGSGKVPDVRSKAEPGIHDAPVRG